MMQHIRGKAYEIHIDDFIYTLENINKNKDVYSSIFDNPILNALKEIHDLYGAVVQCSLFYSIDVNIAFGASVDGYEIGWNLSRMTDKFKTEFEENAHWLRFSFHSYSYDIRYGETTHSRVAGDDYSLIKNEAIRFAGQSSWETNYTKFHWYSGTKKQVDSVISKGVDVFFSGALHYRPQPYYLTGSDAYAFNYNTGEHYDDTNGALFLISTATVERVIGAQIGGSGTPKGMYDYLTGISDGTGEDTKLIDYLSIETHNMELIRNEQVLAETKEAARWCFENGYTGSFYKKPSSPTQRKYVNGWVKPTNWVRPVRA